MVESKPAESALEVDRPGCTLGLGVSIIKENDGVTERKHYFRRRKYSRQSSDPLEASSSGNFCIASTDGVKLKDRKIEMPDKNFVDLTVDSPSLNGKRLTSSAETASPELSFLRRHHRTTTYTRPRTACISNRSSLQSPAEAEIWMVDSEARQTSVCSSGFKGLQEPRNQVNCNSGRDYKKREPTVSLENGGDSGVSVTSIVRKEKKHKESIPAGVSNQDGGCSSDVEQIQGWKRKRSSLTNIDTSRQRFKPPRNVRSCTSNVSYVGGLERPIEIDSLESPSSSMPDENSLLNSSDRARQIEEDELLAKFLQEDYGLEASEKNSVLDDADLARLLQEEENARGMQRRSASSSQTANASTMRAVGREMQRVLPTIRSQTRPASSSRMRILRNIHNRSRQHVVRGGRHRGPAMDPSEHLLHFPEALDLETRVELLAAFETVSQGGLATVDHVDRDFNEGDYEMLLALDDNNSNGSSGASHHKIEQLPISVIKATDVYQDMCSICLEMPVVDDVVRRLPCMHGFHLQCIDEWLGRQASCPVCKMKI